MLIDLLPQLVYRYEQVTLEILLFRFKDISKMKICCSVTQSCPTLCDPVDCSPPGSSVREILQARILEWLAVPISRGSSQPRFPALQEDSL